MSAPRKILLVAPFWGQTGHVGVNRIERFIRWLNEARWEVTLLRASNSDAVRKMEWGTEITVCDPLGLHADGGNREEVTLPARKPNRLRRAMAYALLIPDPTIAWALRAGSSKIVKEASAGASWVLSSSPPESAHFAAERLARKLGAHHLVDMRDGWLDEPLKPQLQNSALRRFVEGRSEGRVLRNASRVLVTSEVWKEMLESRLSMTQGKITVVTNAYPPELEVDNGVSAGNSTGLMLLHSGRLRGSSAARHARVLLEPLLAGFSPSMRGRIEFVGELLPEDRGEIAELRPAFEVKGWDLVEKSPVPRRELLKELPRTSGFLLVSASHAAIPSKLFEYIAARRPILALAPRNSATWRLCEKIGQAYLVDMDSPGGAADVVKEFLAQCGESRIAATVPSDYSEATQRRIFLESLEEA